jgi:hypothetical protein
MLPGARTHYPDGGHVLLLVTIGLVLVGAISLVIGFVSSSLAPIYISIACSIVAGGVLVVFSRMSRKQAPAPAAASGEPLAVPALAVEPVVGEATQTSVPVVPDLPFPIDAYDSLKVNEIVPLLPELDLDELDLVREREVAGRNRATIVKKIDELIDDLEAQAEVLEAAPAATEMVEEPTAAVTTVGAATGGLPIEDYDSLSVAQVLPLLPELDDDELENVAEYEEQHRNRAQILRRIDEIFETGEVAGAAAEKLGVAPAPAKKAASKKKAAAPAKKPAAKKAPAQKKAAAPAKKAAAPAKKPAAKKAAAPAKKTPAKKKAAAPAKKTPAKKKAAAKKR